MYSLKKLRSLSNENICHAVNIHEIKRVDTISKMKIFDHFS